jgi:hypothetical protein
MPMFPNETSRARVRVRVVQLELNELLLAFAAAELTDVHVEGPAVG